MEDKIVEFAGLGFLSGVGLDEVMRQAAIKFPELQQSSGIPIPGYDPAGIHYDDLIVLLSSVGVAVGGYATKSKGLMIAGGLMALGSYIASVVFTPAVSQQAISGSTAYARDLPTYLTQKTDPIYMF